MPSAFAQNVYDIVRQIPAGSTRTYQEVAAMAGRPNAARAVGNILNKNYHPDIPCHRVVRSDGASGGYNRGAKTKRALLAQEKAHQGDPGVLGVL